MLDVEWSGRRDSNSRPHAPQTGNVTARLLRSDDVNHHLRGSQLSVVCAYMHVNRFDSMQDRQGFPHMTTGVSVDEIFSRRSSVLAGANVRTGSVSTIQPREILYTRGDVVSARTSGPASEY